MPSPTLEYYFDISRKKEKSEPETIYENKSEYVYAFKCEDIPNLVKIGITDNPLERFQNANKHDTYKAPSGFRVLHLIKVKNSKKVETYIQKTYVELRRRKKNGQWSEFFEMNEQTVDAIFAKVEGEPVDANQFMKYAEKEEQEQVTKFVFKAIEMDTVCTYKSNPKRIGCQSYHRYEKYSHATSLQQALESGSKREDIYHDFKRGLLTLTIEC
jgi:predicted GIY-YIG superfamily endonuclease